MKTICVFCGSSTGNNEIYQDQARALGKLLANDKISLVFGGSRVGLMGILANSLLESGGNCIGIIPKNIADLEIAHENCSNLHIVENMPQRKNMMAELAEGFVALPGGFGTLDELSEVLTYNQLRIYDKPIGLLNLNGYFDHLLRFLDHSVKEKFVRKEHRSNIIVADNAKELIDKLKTYKPVHIGKWIEDIKEESSLN